VLLLGNDTNQSMPISKQSSEVNMWIKVSEERIILHNEKLSNLYDSVVLE
jgi:hypothetical protein